MNLPKVYFTREISPEAVLRMYEVLGKKLQKRVAVKVHSGEPGNQNFLRPEFFKPVIDAVRGTVVECTTAYEGERNTTDAHKQTLRKHGWSQLYSVDLMDEQDQAAILIPHGKHLKVNYVGAHFMYYDSLLVLSHFKGHPMGGFGGALKNLSIGIASAYGKAYIHGAGDPRKIWTADHDSFLESMADAASSVMTQIRGNAAFVNVMCNMSVDCDCCAVAEDPKIADIGILSSTDPVAIDQACVDLVYASDDPGKADLIERIESRNGTLILQAAQQLGIGSRAYELVNVDR